MIFLGMLLLLLHHVNGQNKMPTIIPKSGLVEIDMNGDATLKCQVQNAQDRYIIWSKIDKDKLKDPVIISTNVTLTVNDPRFKLNFFYDNNEAGTYSLHINNVRQSDAGIYRCSIPITFEDQVQNEISLRVRYPPVIRDNATQTVLATLNNSTQLECTVDGYPKPAVIWTRENGALLQNGKSTSQEYELRLNRVRKEDAGTYYCVADNKIGSSVKKTFEVEVEFQPIVSATKSRVGQALNYNVGLECRVEAFPVPTIVWLKDGKTILNNQQHGTTLIATLPEYYKSVLNISLMERKQYGVYTCQAENKVGRGNVTIELYETDHEICSPACDVGHSNLGYPDKMLILYSSVFVIFAFERW